MTHDRSSPATGTLLPCPFCGGRANIYENQVDFVPKWSVGCGDCNANMDVCADSKQEAADIWNTRASQPATPTGGEDDRLALDAAHQIEALPNDLHPAQKTARIQLIVLEAMRAMPHGIAEERLAYMESKYGAIDWDAAAPSEAARCSAGIATVSIKPMSLSDGRTDYFVLIKVGDREVTPHVFREEYKAAYHVALYDWLLSGSGEEPNVVEFGPDDWPARTFDVAQPVCNCGVMCQDLGKEAGCRYMQPARRELRKLVDIVYQHAADSVPMTDTADKLIDHVFGPSVSSTNCLCPDCGRSIDGPTHAAYCSVSSPQEKTP